MWHRYIDSSSISLQSVSNVSGRYGASAAAPLYLECYASSAGAQTCSLLAGPLKDAAPKKRCALGTLPTAAARGSNANTQRSLSVLAMPQGVDGTLLDLINAHKAADQPIPDALVMYIALQMLLVRCGPLYVPERMSTFPYSHIPS